MNRRALLGLAAAAAVTGCGPAMAVLDGLTAAAKAGNLGQVVGSYLDVADLGKSAFFRRHPSLDRQNKVDDALTGARQALAAYDAAVNAGQSVAEGKLPAAKAALLKAYSAVRALLESMGILDATPPEGGAETDAPKPEPFELPTAAELEPIA